MPGRTFDAILRWFCADTTIEPLPPGPSDFASGPGVACMSSQPDLANLISRNLDSIASITRTSDGVRVITHCMYPSNGLVQVTVRGGVETVVASDEGGSVGEALGAGLPFKAYNGILELARQISTI